MKKVLFLLGKLEHQDIEWILEEGELRKVQEKEILIQTGVQFTHLFLVLTGRFSVYNDDENSKEIAQIGAGEILGELSFIDSKAPSATVMASEFSEVLCLRKEEVKRKLDNDSGFASRFYYSLALLLSHRLRKSNTGHTEYGEDEIDENLLDYIHQAGSSFNQIIQEIRSRE